MTLISCTVIWPVYGFSVLGIAIFGLGIYDLSQKEHSILRNFPVIGHIRFLLEIIVPEIHQYFIEADTDGKPIDRNHRTYISQSVKLERSTSPFGTKLNVEVDHYKWMQHSIYPTKVKDKQPRVWVGNSSCEKKYESSIFNISSMSYKALSKYAILALNKGAKAGDFSTIQAKVAFQITIEKGAILFGKLVQGILVVGLLTDSFQTKISKRKLPIQK